MKPTVSVRRILPPPSRSTAAGRRVEGGEEAVFHEHVRTGERPHQGGLAGVRVPHESNAKEVVTPLARGRQLRSDSAELAPQPADTVADQAPIDLELGLAGTAHSGRAHAPDGAAARLPREVRPLAGEARQQVLELRELDLHHCSARAGVSGEDVEHDGAAVEDPLAGEPLEVAHLSRRQVVVEDNHVGSSRVRAFLQFVGLALADVVRHADARLRLQHPVDHDEHRGLGEPGELVDGVLGLPHGSTWQNEADEQSGLPRDGARVAHGAGVIAIPVRDRHALDVLVVTLQPDLAPDAARRPSPSASITVKSLCASHSGRGWAEGRLSVRL